MEDILKRLGVRIREERKKARLTQEKFAERVGLSVDYIGYIERGKQAPYLKTLERIAKTLGVEVYELFIFRKDGKKVDEDMAIKELILSVRNRNPDDIRFIASILKQIFERKHF
ncbi:MAG: helix-turn-helix transcriptional regulator [Deltaproteobacteria bacterium]|nr:helix-turn-helix transcriptional regulator [Deltaproteobacteria bacterium]